MDENSGFNLTPGYQGLLTAGLSMLANSRGQNSANAIGMGGLQGLLGYNQAMQQQLQNKRQAEVDAQNLALGKFQLNNASRQDRQQQEADAFYSQPLSMQPAVERPQQPSSIPQLNTPGQTLFQNTGFQPVGVDSSPAPTMISPARQVPTDWKSQIAPMLSSGNPLLIERAHKLAEFMPKPAAPQLVDIQDPTNPGRTIKQWVVPGQSNGVAVGAVPEKLPEGIMFGPDGQRMIDQEYLRLKQGIASAGKPVTSIKIENKTGESLANQIGPMVKDSWNAANGALQSADAANRVIQAVDTGNIIAGPMANERMKVAQISQMLGVGGKDDSEKIANTRKALNGLAQMTLQGRKQMTGQGAITENEGALAERAMSGDITMTPAEIKQLANASLRAGKFTYDQHQMQINNMQQDPNLANMARFYQTSPFPAAQQRQQQSPQTQGMPPAVTVVKRGMYGGKAVEMLSDGSTRYAN